MSLYRAQIPRARDLGGAAALARARCATLSAPFALIAFALGLFVPIKGHDTPLGVVFDEHGREQIFLLLFLWPPYFCAAALAATLLLIALRERARRRRRSALPRPADHRLFRMAFWVVAGTAVSAVGLLGLLATGSPPARVAVVFSGAALGSMAAGGALGWRARRTTGWRRWGHLLAAFTALATPILVLHVYFFFENQDVGFGAWMCGCASLASWILAAVAAWPRRRRRP
jgi:hypothetical protein